MPIYTYIWLYIATYGHIGLCMLAAVKGLQRACRWPAGGLQEALGELQGVCSEPAGGLQLTSSKQASKQAASKPL